VESSNTFLATTSVNVRVERPEHAERGDRVCLDPKRNDLHSEAVHISAGTQGLLNVVVLKYAKRGIGHENCHQRDRISAAI
jgi:hypothetical protein